MRLHPKPSEVLEPWLQEGFETRTKKTYLMGASKKSLQTLIEKPRARLNLERGELNQYLQSHQETLCSM